MKAKDNIQSILKKNGFEFQLHSFVGNNWYVGYLSPDESFVLLVLFVRQSS